MVQGGPGGRGTWGRVAIAGYSMCPGRAVYDVKGPGIVPGAAPMGAGLVPSTGATGAVKAGGRSHARNGGPVV